MPIGGFVVHVIPEKKDDVLKGLTLYPQVSIYGHDDQGHVIVVLETQRSEEMEKLVQELLKIEGIISFDLAYLHGEDEVEEIEAGHYKPKIRFHRFRT